MAEQVKIWRKLVNELIMRPIFPWNKVDPAFNLLTCRQEISKTFLLYWHVFFILIVSLHTKAGLTALLNQYWRSKALVLRVYRSLPSAGLCFFCTFWSLSVCWRRDWRTAMYAAFIYIRQIPECKISQRWFLVMVYLTIMHILRVFKNEIKLKAFYISTNLVAHDLPQFLCVSTLI